MNVAIFYWGINSKRDIFPQSILYDQVSNGSDGTTDSLNVWEKKLVGHISVGDSPLPLRNLLSFDLISVNLFGKLSFAICEGQFVKSICCVSVSRKQFLVFY